MAINTATALIGSAIIGAGASAATSSSAAQKAANSSQYATDQSIALNNRALDLQQQNTQPYRDAGAIATNALLQRLGLVPATGQAATGTATDWNAVLADRPDVAAAVNDPNGGFNGATAQERAADWYNRYGRDSGYQLPATAQAQQTTQIATPTNNTPGLDPARPNLVQTPAYQAPATTVTPAYQAPATTVTPAYQAPEFTMAPAYQAPTMDPLDVSLERYQRDPSYEWQQSEAARATLAGSAATGSLRSGAAAKALQDRAQQIANADYTNWRGYTTGQYNTDRSRADQNAQFGYNALLSQTMARNTANQNNAQFGYNALTNQNQFRDTAAINAAQFGYNALTNQNQFRDTAAINAAQFGYNALTNQNNATNQYNQQGFNTDRAFTADQQQQGTNNLFSLAGMGASAANASNSAVGANAANTSNALFSNAAAQGNAALASAGQVNNAINTGTNALTWYLGNRPTTGASSGGVYGPVA